MPDRKNIEKIAIVTSNIGKMREFEELLGKHLELEQINVECPEIQSDSLEEISCYSANFACKSTNRSVIVEDSGLFIHALKGFPGPYSSYAQKTIGNEGILRLMKGIKNRKACFKSVIGFCLPIEEPISFEGIVNGNISHEIRGKEGFGYDPIFIPEGYDKTFGEDAKLKNRISHRKRAIEGFIAWLEKRD